MRFLEGKKMRDSEPECGETEVLGERTFTWDCKHREWVDVTPVPEIIKDSVVLR
jgi:hypothetical protein